MDSVLAHIKEFFSGMIGLNPESLADQIWVQTLAERMAASKKSDPQNYLKYLLTSKDEQNQFVQRIVVPETWFFRYQASYEYLRELAHDTLKNPLRILSVPCSTGEEPYSIAIALLEAGLIPEEFSIDAVDISSALLETAKKGAYGSYSFRNRPEYYRKHYFTEHNGLYHIDDVVKKQVRFIQGNIVASDFLATEKPYDIIFCRNLFIYLQPQAVERFRARLEKLLNPDGFLFVSPVESHLLLNWGYQKTGPGESAAFSRAEEKEIVEQKIAPKPQLLEQAKKEADEGRFESAHALCSKHLEENRLDSEGYFLLGVIAHARSDLDQAEKSFRKALYLSPTHEKAMTYLALLAQNRGDFQEAKQFLDRRVR